MQSYGYGDVLRLLLDSDAGTLTDNHLPGRLPGCHRHDVQRLRRLRSRWCQLGRQQRRHEELAGGDQLRRRRADCPAFFFAVLAAVANHFLK